MCNVNLGVGNLPEQEVADARFAARADEQVGVGQHARVELRFDDLFVDLFGAQATGGDFFGDAAAGVYELCAPAVIDGDVQLQAGVLHGRQFGTSYLLKHGNVQPVAAANQAKANVVVAQRLQFLAQELHQQIHQRADFEARALPVLG